VQTYIPFKPRLLTPAGVFFLQDAGCGMQGAGYRMQDAGCRMLDDGNRMLGARNWAGGILSGGSVLVDTR